LRSPDGDIGADGARLRIKALVRSDFRL